MACAPVIVLVAVRPGCFPGAGGVDGAGPGCLVRRGRRPVRETRRPSFARCRASKPARALRSHRRPSHSRGLAFSNERGSGAPRRPPHSRGLARLDISRFSSTWRRPSCSLLVVVASVDLWMPRLGLLIGALHPIRRHCTSSDRVHSHRSGALPPIGCTATDRVQRRVDAVGARG